MVTPSDDGRNCRDDPRGVVEHLAVVGSQHNEAQCHDRLISPKICPSVGRLGVVRLTVALDQKSVADKQIGTCEVANRKRRLGR